MRAYVYKASPVDGSAIVGTGRITGDYKSLRTLLQYGVAPFRKSGESVRIEIHYNWDSRYKSPDKVIVL